jgi:hypothetical protein
MKDFFIYTGILIVLFFLFRELNLWYFKINETINNQKTTIKILTEILNKLSDEKDVTAKTLDKPKEPNPLDMYKNNQM